VLPPCEDVWQQLAGWFGDALCRHLPVERRLSKFSVVTHVASDTHDDYPAPPDFQWLFDPDWPDLPPEVLTDSEVDDR